MSIVNIPGHLQTRRQYTWLFPVSLPRQGVTAKSTRAGQHSPALFVIHMLIAAVVLFLTAGIGIAIADDGAILHARELAVQALTDRLSESDGELYIYKNFASSVNHYTQKAKIFGSLGDNVHDLDENWVQDSVSGSAIRCEQDTVFGDWGGWMFLNGYLPEGETVPRLNDGGRTAAIRRGCPL